jgi:competence protein ComEC
MYLRSAAQAKRFFFGMMLCVCIALLAWREYSLLPDGRLHLLFLDVGQGDAALIVTPQGRRILIDGGPDWTALRQLGEHLPFFDRRIDLLVLTHPHQDHLASFPEIIRRYPVGSVLMAGTPYVLGRYQAFMDALATERVPVIGPEVRRIQVESGVTLAVLWPPPDTFGAQVGNVNIASVVTMLEYRTHRALFTGDIEEVTERELVRLNTDLHADILKVPHHGSRGSSSAQFLQAVGMATAVISSGSGNTFGHPRPEALQRLAEAGALIRRTDQEGTIAITWD